MKISQLRQIIREEIEAMVERPVKYDIIIRNYGDGSGNPETWSRDLDKETFLKIEKMLEDRFTKILSKEEARSVVGNMKDKEEIFVEPYYKFDFQDFENEEKQIRIKRFLVHSRKDNTGKIGDRK